MRTGDHTVYAGFSRDFMALRSSGRARRTAIATG